MPTFLIAGILASFFALVLELLLGSIPGFEYAEPRTGLTDPGTLAPLTLFLFAVIEEVTKFSVLRKISLNKEVHDIFPSGSVIFALGFGATEATLAFLKFSDAPILALAGIIALHGATILLYGYGIGKHFSKPLFVIVLGMGIIAHFLYNMILA